MSDILADLRRVAELRGDTYSSAEVIGMLGRAADEIERLRAKIFSIGILNASGPHPDPEIDRVIREVA